MYNRKGKVTALVTRCKDAGGLIGKRKGKGFDDFGDTKTMKRGLLLEDSGVGKFTKI